jgi:hypothetical protein
VTDDRLTEQERRVGLNEAVFREVNERIRDLGEEFGLSTQPLDLVCECGNADCAERIELTAAEYERVRADAALFAIVPGHQIEEVEEVVVEERRYAIVRKHEGGPARLAEETDRRA